MLFLFSSPALHAMGGNIPPAVATLKGIDQGFQTLSCVSFRLETFMGSESVIDSRHKTPRRDNGVANPGYKGKVMQHKHDDTSLESTWDPPPLRAKRQPINCQGEKPSKLLFGLFRPEGRILETAALSLKSSATSSTPPVH